MRIYIAFADDARDAAQRITSAIVAEGHQVWRRPNDLPPGESEPERARAALAESDFFVFIASPQALACEATLSDLAAAQTRWKRARTGILPVVVGGATREQLPPFLAALDPIAPKGDLAADVANAIASRLQRPGRRGRWAWRAGAGALLVGALGYYALQWAEERRFAAISQAMDFEVESKGQIVWGGVAKYRLSLSRPLPDVTYMCRVGASKSPNIAKITHDSQCNEIAVHMSDGPFRDLGGKGFDIVPYVIEVEGREVYRGQLSVDAGNPSSTAMRLHGLEKASGSAPYERKYAIRTGHSYDLSVGFAEHAMPESYECSLKDHLPTGPTPRPRIGGLSNIQGCRFRLERAAPGLLSILVRKRGSDYSLTGGFWLEESSAAPAGIVPNAADGPGDGDVTVDFYGTFPNIWISYVTINPIWAGAKVFVSVDGKTFRPFEPRMGIRAEASKLIFELRRSNGEPFARIDKSAQLQKFLKGGNSSELRAVK